MNNFTIVKSLQFPFTYLYEQGLPEHISLKVEKKKKGIDLILNLVSFYQ